MTSLIVGTNTYHKATLTDYELALYSDPCNTVYIAVGSIHVYNWLKYIRPIHVYN